MLICLFSSLHSYALQYHQGIYTTTSISGLNPFTMIEITQQLRYCIIFLTFISIIIHSFIHSLVFSLIGRVGRNQNPVM